MPSSSRARRPQPDFDDFDDDEFGDGGPSREIGQEKAKQLALDLAGRWHWIALGLVLGLLGGFYYLSKAPKIYKARSTLLIKQQTSSVMSRDQVDEIDYRSLEAMNTVAERITRPELLQKVAARPEVRQLPGLMPKPVIWMPEWSYSWFGIENEDIVSAPPPAPDVLAGYIGLWTKISVRRGTRLLDVDITHPSPAVAKTLADTIAVEYQAELTGARSTGRNNSLQILIEESEAARLRLQTAQTALANYQRALVTLKELELKENLVAELRRKYLPKHPRMIAASADLTAQQQKFLAEFGSAKNSTSDREYWDSHAADWEAAVDPASQLMTARRLLLARGNVLEGEIASQASVFNSMLTRIQEGEINQQAVESEMEISSLAELPTGPISPVASKIIAMGSAGGLAFGTLLAMIFIRLDNKFHTVSQVERESGLPALAAVSTIQSAALAIGNRKTNSASAAESSPRDQWSPTLLFRNEMSTTTFAEMFRVLRASVSLLGDEKKRKITLFSSALPGEGKTFVSSNFALAAAQQGKRTILIDLDLRKPAVHKIFGMKRDSHPFGATEVISGQASFEDGILKNTGEENLHLMLSGMKAPNPGELLNATTLREFLNKATSLYDLVVIDSAPLLAVPDTRIIAPLVDNFCLVVRAGFVPKGALKRVISMLDNDHHLPSGIVFNGFTEKRRLIGQNYSYGNYQSNKYGQAYRYGYGSYGSYGSGKNKDDD